MDLRGVYTLTITAKSSAGTATQAFTLTVTKAPVIKTIPTTTGHVGSTLSLTITAKGYTTPMLVESGTLPSGVSFTDNGNGTAKIAGVPAVGSGGAHTITITATNALGTATQSFTLKIDEAPTVTSAATATASIGARSPSRSPRHGLIRRRGSRRLAPYLPKGVSFTAATGTFSGTPKAGTTGSYPITITATNSSKAVTQQFDLTVQ
ncbi:MAG: putative Ig domain-containing protein [Solirubrobacteraceae bacterium]